MRALDAGADDYVVKPFGARPGRRPDPGHPAPRRRQDRRAPIVVGELVVDPRTRTAELAGRPLELARKEFELLLALASRPDEVVTKRELLVEVWQQPYGGADRTIDVHVSGLRRKLGETAAQPRYLHTVRGVGIRLVGTGRTAVVSRRIAWLVAATTSAVILAFVVPLCLLVRELAQDRAMASGRAGGPQRRRPGVRPARRRDIGGPGDRGRRPLERPHQRADPRRTRCWAVPTTSWRRDPDVRAGTSRGQRLHRDDLGRRKGARAGGDVRGHLRRPDDASRRTSLRVGVGRAWASIGSPRTLR